MYYGRWQVNENACQTTLCGWNNRLYYGCCKKGLPWWDLKSNTDEYGTYRLFARCMLDKHCPKSVFKNKLLLQNHSTHVQASYRKAKKPKWKFNRKRVYIKTTFWENPLYENDNSYVSEQGVGRWSVKKKIYCFIMTVM